MIKHFFLPLVALIGIGFGIFMIHFTNQTPLIPPVVFSPPVSPYKHFVAGQGIVESAYKNIAIAPPFGEQVTDVYVTVGSYVKKGDPLFKLDTRHLEAQLKTAEQNLAIAKTDYEYQKNQYSFYKRLKHTSAVSEQAFQATFYAMKLAEQRVETSKAALKTIITDIERSTICAPLDSQILQLNARPGQFASPTSSSDSALVMLGDTASWHLRINVDEEDAWRIMNGAPATAFIRGNARIIIPLEFVYIEPYIIPKKSLSGSDFERVDTRVLQIVYRFNKDTLPVYLGQLLDVYIEAKPSEEAR